MYRWAVAPRVGARSADDGVTVNCVSDAPVPRLIEPTSCFYLSRKAGGPDDSDGDGDGAGDGDADGDGSSGDYSDFEDKEEWEREEWQSPTGTQ